MRKLELAFPKPKPKPVPKQNKQVPSKAFLDSTFLEEYQDFLDYAGNGMSPLRFKTQKDVDKWWQEQVAWRDSLPPIMTVQDRIAIETIWDSIIKEYRYYSKWVAEISGI